MFIFQGERDYNHTRFNCDSKKRKLVNNTTGLVIKGLYINVGRSSKH